MQCSRNSTKLTKLILTLSSLLVLSTSCYTQQRAFSRTLPDGDYRVKSNGQWKKALVYNNEDTSFLLFDTAAQSIPVADYLYTNGSLELVSHNLGLDAFGFPVKLRFPQKEVPRQLNAHLNGNFYMGYRTDRYFYGSKTLAPGIVQRYRHQVSYGAGGFAGIGSVFINPTFLQEAITYEYDGLAFTYGAAVVMGYGRISTGLGLGFDILTDRYRRYWIYQNKPWLGIVIGLHLN